MENTSNNKSIPINFAPELTKSVVVPIHKVDKFLDRNPQYVEDDWRTEPNNYSFAQD